MATKAGTGKGIILLLSCAAQFMVVLDIAIVNVALLSIQQALAALQNNSAFLQSGSIVRWSCAQHHAPRTSNRREGQDNEISDSRNRGRFEAVGDSPVVGVRVKFVPFRRV